VAAAPGIQEEGVPDSFSGEPVRYLDGTVNLSADDLGSDAFGVRWGQARFWTNAPGYAATAPTGSGWVIAQLPYLRQNAAGTEVIGVSFLKTWRQVTGPEGRP
jgi:hypothetical protein